MKVLFLDIDGVLNCEETFKGKSIYSSMWEIDPKLVERFNTIIENVDDLTIVLSSSWRYAVHSRHIDLDEILRNNGYRGKPITERTCLDGEVEDKGIIVPSMERGKEIQRWLDDHPEVEKFVILDDDDDMCHLMDHLIQTSYEHGLTDAHVEQVIERLK